MTIVNAVCYTVCSMIGGFSGFALWYACEKRLAAKASREVDQSRKDQDEQTRIAHLKNQALKDKDIGIGSVVKFIPGGPNMLVIGICAGDYTCRWFDQFGHPQSAVFRPCELQKVSDRSDPSDGKQSKEN